MIQLDPQEIFVICRQLDDPTDTNKYYVRAYIRNAKTDELLDTVDLTDQGDQRFRGEYQVPADVSGEGFYITITTKVYTDSGYTNESPNYAREENQYLVQKRYNPILGSGGGDHTDYKKVRKIVQEELKKVRIPKADLGPVIKTIKGIKIPKQKEIDLTWIGKEINSLKKEIRNLPKPQRIDLGLIRKRIERVERKIENIEIPEIPEVDLSRIEQKIEDTNERISSIKIPEPEKVDFTPVYQKINEENLKLQREIEKIKNELIRIKDSLKKGISLNVVGAMAEQPTRRRRFI